MTSKKTDLASDPAYQKLVKNIRRTLDEAYVKGVDLNRAHFLDCFACQCFEGLSKSGSRIVFRKDGSASGLDVDFTVLNIKRRDYLLKKGGLRWRTTYHYICGLCGAQQRVCHVDEFSKPC